MDATLQVAMKRVAHASVVLRRVTSDEPLQRLRAVRASAPQHLVIEDDLLLMRFDTGNQRAALRHACEFLEGPLLCLTFLEQGILRYVDRKGRCWPFEAGQSIAQRLRDAAQARRLQVSPGAGGLHLVVGERTLSRYMGEQQARRLLHCQGEAPLLQCSTSRDACSHVQALATRLAQGQCAPLDTHLHVLNLLSNPLHQLTVSSSQTTPLLPAAQVKRLEQARQLLHDELDQPLTVQVLCRRVGLSAAKLKHGFHQLFHTTPYRMLLQLRMQLAHALLQEGCQVAQVAYKVGYSHPSNFSAAFSGYFGFAPKTVAKRGTVST
ncbi:helix-turn-helix transcriptional regulator [Pseudomonas putida]|uniref:helix-turn-helix transcriptional regulator n=1 Tax=Pseudomonas putida TaxID=303 RepID=UPI00276F236A|nr:AraC family transcriptional regulator [Pseudomonas putida]EKT4480426.1 helix-turn-helix transcriptional regulator [Pseudomonas putida]MDP9523139.1 AraC family transcriptional regulator [Pseudomonas putida]